MYIVRVFNDIMHRSCEQTLITKEYIATQTQIQFLFKRIQKCFEPVYNVPCQRTSRYVIETSTTSSSHLTISTGIGFKTLHLYEMLT